MSATMSNGSVSSRVVSCRLVIPWRGVWFAECDLDPSDATNYATGAVSLALGGVNLAGTTATNEGGRFVSSVKLVVWGGANGWATTVARQDFANDGGVSTAQTLQSVASIIGETLAPFAAESVGINYARIGGPASRIFGDADWYVDLAGVTHLGGWPTAAADSSLQVLSYDPERLVLEVACDVPVLPGTQVADSRFDGMLIVRSVEQTYSADGIRARLWCSAVGVDRFMGVLTNLVRELVGRQTLRCYRYRLVLQGTDGRVQLQCVTPGLGAPDTLPISVWAGMQGDSAELALSSEMIVHFAEGNASLPMVLGFAPGVIPTSRTVDASTSLKLGPSAADVAIAGGGAAVGRVGDRVSVTFTSLDAGGLEAPSGGGPCTLVAGALTLTGTITSGSPKVMSG